MRSISNFMLLFEFSGPKLVSMPNFSSMSLKMTELFKNFTFLLRQILQGTFCNFVAMVILQGTFCNFVAMVTECNKLVQSVKCVSKMYL